MALGLVLAGGGAKGAFEVGVIAAMEEAGLAPTVLSGTSAGALNAAGLATGMDAATLTEVWKSADSADVYGLRNDVWRLPRPSGLFGGGNVASRLLDSVGWTWLLETEALRHTLTRALGSERIEVAAGRSLAVSAVEVASGELVRFTNVLPPVHRRTPRFREVDLTVDHLMASSAIPVLFEPATLGGVDYWDGGLVANTPLAPALAYEPDAVIVVTTATRERPAKAPHSLGQALSLLIDNVLAYSLASDLGRAEDINVLCRVDPEATERRLVDIVVVQPTGLDLGESLDFAPELVRRRIDLGREAGRRAFADWDARR